MQLLLKLRNLSLHLATFIKVTQPLANHNLDHLLHKLGGVLHTNAEGEAHTQRIKPIVSFFYGYRGKCNRHKIFLKTLLKSEHFHFLRLFTHYCRWTHLSKGQPLCNSDKLYPSWIISKLLAVIQFRLLQHVDGANFSEILLSCEHLMEFWSKKTLRRKTLL